MQGSSSSQTSSAEGRPAAPASAAVDVTTVEGIEKLKELLSTMRGYTETGPVSITEAMIRMNDENQGLFLWDYNSSRNMVTAIEYLKKHLQSASILQVPEIPADLTMVGLMRMLLLPMPASRYFS